MKMLFIIIALALAPPAFASAKKPVVVKEPFKKPPTSSDEEPANPSPEAPKPSPASPVPSGAAIDAQGCPAAGHWQMADYVGTAAPALLDLFKARGIRLIGRYYDWIPQNGVARESLRGKIPQAAELAALKAKGFEMVTVFQHLNNRATSFTAARGKYDAGQILELAKQWGQPLGSAVYLGVDGDFELSVPKPYFEAAVPILRAAGYRVGMYGSGSNCEGLKKLGLVDGNLCWIAASSWGWRGTKAILAKGTGYAIAQKVNQKCQGKSLDYDKILQPDVGQWQIP